MSDVNPWYVSHEHPLHAFFQEMVETIFIEHLHVCEIPLTEYLAEVLSDFVHIDSIYRFRNAKGKRIEQIAEMLAEAEIRNRQGLTDWRLILHKHIGDFLLFWMGIYPEYLNWLRRRKHQDVLIDYARQAKDSYKVAADQLEQQAPDQSALFRQLSNEFEICVFGLDMVRREWEKQAKLNAAQFIGQVVA